MRPRTTPPRLVRRPGGQVVRVDAETHADLKRLAKERGDSMARVLEALIHEAIKGEATC